MSISRKDNIELKKENRKNHNQFMRNMHPDDKLKFKLDSQIIQDVLKQMGLYKPKKPKKLKSKPKL